LEINTAMADWQCLAKLVAIENRSYGGLLIPT
jgi:hypothetical protein